MYWQSLNRGSMTVPGPAQAARWWHNTAHVSYTDPVCCGRRIAPSSAIASPTTASLFSLRAALVRLQVAGTHTHSIPPAGIANQCVTWASADPKQALTVRYDRGPIGSRSVRGSRRNSNACRRAPLPNEMPRGRRPVRRRVARRPPTRLTLRCGAGSGAQP